MHEVRAVEYLHDYHLLVQFEDGSWRDVDMEPELYGPVFEPLKDLEYFKTVSVNHDIVTIVWPNEADLSPDHLWEMGVPVEDDILVHA